MISMRHYGFAMLAVIGAAVAMAVRYELSDATARIALAVIAGGLGGFALSLVIIRRL